MERGAAAGLLGGALAAAVAFAAGRPLLAAAIAVEEQLHGHGQDHTEALSTAARGIGMGVGLLLVGVVIGVLFGLLAAWAAGRVGGDAWTRPLRLGGALLLGLVALPALAYPPNPPGAIEDAPGRGLAYVAVLLIGCVLVAALRLAGRALTARGVWRPARQTLVGGMGVAAAAAVLLLRPDLARAVPEFPAELLWRFRLASIAVQMALVGGTAVAFGLLAARAERRAGQRAAVTAR